MSHLIEKAKKQIEGLPNPESPREVRRWLIAQVLEAAERETGFALREEALLRAGINGYGQSWTALPGEELRRIEAGVALAKRRAELWKAAHRELQAFLGETRSDQE